MNKTRGSGKKGCMLVECLHCHARSGTIEWEPAWGWICVSCNLVVSGPRVGEFFRTEAEAA